jgi:hypothetical protein
VLRDLGGPAAVVAVVGCGRGGRCLAWLVLRGVVRVLRRRLLWRSAWPGGVVLAQIRQGGGRIRYPCAGSRAEAGERGAACGLTRRSSREWRRRGRVAARAAAGGVRRGRGMPRPRAGRGAAAGAPGLGPVANPSPEIGSGFFSDVVVAWPVADSARRWCHGGATSGAWSGRGPLFSAWVSLAVRCGCCPSGAGVAAGFPPSLLAPCFLLHGGRFAAVVGVVLALGGGLRLCRPSPMSPSVVVGRSL